MQLKLTSLVLLLVAISQAAPIIEDRAGTKGAASIVRITNPLF